VSSRLAWMVALGAALVIALACAAAQADSFSPVTLGIGVTPVARLGVPLRVKVTVHADPGVLDTADGPLRVQVKLASECGGNFQTTTGVTLVNAPLNPPPTVGVAYSGGASGSGRPAAYGMRTLCTFLEDSGSNRVYANDESVSTSVTAACTSAGRAYDSASRALRAAQHSLRRAHTRAARRRDRRLMAKRRSALAAARRRGVAACGSGVPL
jgi:hypothetical protein